MLTVALLAAGITLRIALHGGEVQVPDFAGLSLSEASDAALHKSLGITVESKYYSTTVPAGRVLSQSPAAGSRVRKKWPVRVTVSLGPQQVEIPDVVGQPQRDAAMSLRRKSLDLGAISHLGAPGDPDMVLAQSPPPNAGLDRPRVSLLLSQSDDPSTAAFVMPSFVGLSLSAANHAAASVGLKTAWVADTPASGAAPALPAGAHLGPAGTMVDASGNAIATPVPAAPAAPGGPVTGQKPEAGHRAIKGDTVRLLFGHAGQAQAATP